MVDSKTTKNLDTARTTPGTGLSYGTVLLAAILLYPQPPVSAEIRSVMSPNGQMRAYAVERGERRALLTEIWLSRDGGASRERIRTYPGAAGPLGFLPDGTALVYLERSLRYPAFGSYLSGGRSLPIVKNRIWVLAVDGSDESRWPLPPELNPLDVAVSPDGDFLAVRGEWDALVDWGQPGLWRVDRAGRATQLSSAMTAGAPCWSGDGARVYFVESDSTSEDVKFVHVETGEVGTEAPSEAAGVRAIAETPRDEFESTPDARDQVSLQRALAELQRGMIRFSRMNSAVHRADRHREKDARKAVERMFAGFHKHHKDLRISKTSCLAYVATLREQQLRTGAAAGEHACLEHMLVLNDLAHRYAEKHGALPNDHSVLHGWVKQSVDVQATSEAELRRDKEVLGIVFSCPTTSESEPLIEYLYRPDAAPGMPVLACFRHPDRYLHLTETPDARSLEAEDMRSETVDSLFAVVLERASEERLREAAALFRLVAVQRPKDAPLHIELGHAYHKAEDYKRAMWAFKKAISLQGGARAYYGVGLVYAEIPKERNLAIHYFQEALARDHGYVDARYQIARLRYLMNEYDVGRAVDRVLDLDPNYADAFRLMGDWYADFWKDYEQAIVWYTRYMALRPGDSSLRSRLGVAYLMIEDYEKIMAKLLGFVEENPDAIELMPIVAQASMKQGKPDMAMEFFEDYVAKLPSHERVLYEDIRLVSSFEEITEFNNTPQAERPAFLRRFWNDRDPDLSTPVNERLLEHYRRVWQALTEFSENKQPWDVRGEVYIRFGEPDHRSRSDRPNYKQSLAVQRVKERLAANIYGGDGMGETFTGPVFPVRGMRRLEGEWYEFREAETPGLRRGSAGASGESGGSAGGDEFSGGGGGYGGPVPVEDVMDTVRLGLMDMDKRLGFGDYHPVTSGEDRGTIPWETWIYTDVGGGIEITFTDEFGSGTYEYAPMPPNRGDIDLGQTAKLRNHSPREIYKRAARVEPNYYAPEEETAPLDFHYSLADFRGEDDRSLLEIYYGVPILPAHYDSEENVTRQVLTHHAALISSTMDTVYRKSDGLTYEAEGNQAGEGIQVPGVLKLNLPPGAYRLEVRSQDRLRGRMGAYSQQVVVEPYGEDRLQISDLELAWKVASEKAGSPFNKGDLNVVPLPSRTFKKGQGVFVYYEIYNLAKDAFGQTNYTVSHTITSRDIPGTISNISRLFRWRTGIREELAVTYEQQGEAAQEVEYVELDLAEQAPGRYSLKVSIEDRNSGETAEKDVVFVIAP